MNFSKDFRQILDAIPHESTEINWDVLQKTQLSGIFAEMQQTQQNPLYHAEGDVFAHTKSVCEHLVKLPEYAQCSRHQQEILFVAALLHDIGKIKCTTVVDGEIVSPKHTIVGAFMARELLWTTFDLAGDKHKQDVRETICLLVRFHSYPPFAIYDDSHPRKMLAIAANGELAPSFNLKLLYILEKADVLGRICDESDYLEKIECFKILAQEADCFECPYKFTTTYSQRAYFSKKTNWQGDTLYNGNWGEVVLLCGLPASGKDTYLAKNYSHLPVVCLDDIRKLLDVSPTKPQGEVIAYAKNKAKELLRNKQSFVWNATNITKDTRHKLISLFENYGASVRVVFLETSWEVGLERNSTRKDVVPQNAVEAMLSKLEPPKRMECEFVEWITN